MTSTCHANSLNFFLSLSGCTFYIYYFFLLKTINKYQAPETLKPRELLPYRDPITCNFSGSVWKVLAGNFFPAAAKPTQAIKLWNFIVCASPQEYNIRIYTVLSRCWISSLVSDDTNYWLLFHALAITIFRLTLQCQSFLISVPMKHPRRKKPN